MKHFDGDGRLMMEPTIEFPGCRSIRVRTSVANRMVDSFRESGWSNHSTAGSTLWVILRFCREAEIPFTLTVVPKRGYNVKRVRWEEINSKEASA